MSQGFVIDKHKEQMHKVLVDSLITAATGVTIPSTVRNQKDKQEIQGQSSNKTKLFAKRVSNSTL